MSREDEHARGERSPRLRAALNLVPALIVTVYGLWLLWPVPLGHMPRSADHPVHLARAVETARQLSEGRLAGWSERWFFGTPVGDLYPQLGDFLVIGIRGLSFGAMEWSTAYALAFTIAFLTQGWAVLRFGRALGLGPVAGVVGAMLLMADPGFTREGGWIYTVWFGVWPQAFATSLLWLGMAELALASRVRLQPSEHDEPDEREPFDEPAARARLTRHVALAGLWLGGALLAHPMTMLVLAMAGPLFVLVVGPRSRLGLRHTAAAAAIAAGLAVLLSAWWLLPMLEHRGWMASYGWLFAGLDPLLEQARQGVLTRAMAPIIGYAALVGLALAAIRGDGPLRFAALLTVLMWLLATTEAFWELRLDHLSEGFTHVQYQRFLIAAKPGLFLMVGAVLASLVQLGQWLFRLGRAPERSGVNGKLLLGSAALPVALAAWAAVLLVTGARAQAEDEQLAMFRPIQVARHPERPELDADVRELAAWLDERLAEDPSPWRVAVIAQRNSHWFMDLTVLSPVRLYKPGFTPGDNFVHKPESRHRAVLDALGVRYEIRLQRGDRPQRHEVARFGDLRVLERPGVEPRLAHLEGPGELISVDGEFASGRVRAVVSGSGEGTRLVFHTGGYPRWRVHMDGERLDWFEVPVWGDVAAATPDQRRAGELRGGKAHGDDGSEPTLLAVDVPHDGTVELEYRHRRRSVWPLAILAVLVTIALLLAAVPLPTEWHEDGRLGRARATASKAVDLVGRITHPAVLAVALVAAVAVLGVRWRRGAVEERRQAVGRVIMGAAQIEGEVEPGPLKAGMLIRPALIAKGRSEPARVAFRDVRPGPTLTGWAAVDDDRAKARVKGDHTMTIELRAGGGDWR